VRSQFRDLIDHLVVTTDRLLTGARTASVNSWQSCAQGTEPLIAPVPLVWSVALRVNRDIFIQASIEYVAFVPNFISFIYSIVRIGRSREFNRLVDSSQFKQQRFRIGYWHDLWSSADFIDQPLKDCLNVIHEDIVEIWNLNDRTRVSSPLFLCCFLVPHRDQYLSGIEFKKKMSHNVKDLVGSLSGAPSR